MISAIVNLYYRLLRKYKTWKAHRQAAKYDPYIYPLD